MTWQGIVKSRVSRRPRLSFFPLGRAIVLATTIPYADALMNWSIFSGSFEQSKLLFLSLPEGSPTESILQNSLQEDKPIVRQTINWLQRSVIGLNLCPFAEKPFIQKRVSIEVIRGTDQVEILARVLTECLDRRKRPGTSLLICPELFPSNFLSFLEVYNMLQDGVLVDNGIDRDIQVAPFHPYFEFDGSGDNVDNYTNRSPFPIFHILREEEVSVAVDALQGDAEKVWKRNIQLLEALEDELGRDRTEQILKGTEQDAASRTAIERILEKVKKDGLPSQ